MNIKTCLSLTFLIFISNITAQQQTIRYSSAAYDQKSGAHLYNEYHTETVEAGKTIMRKVTYAKSAKEIIAEKTVNYGPSQIAPNFDFFDHRRKYQQGAKRQANGILLYSKENQNAELKSATIAALPDLVIDAGFDKYILQNWDALLAGKKIKFKFAVPSRRDYYTFSLVKKDIITVNKQKAMRVKMSVDSLVLSFFAEDIFATYALEGNHKLLSYHGIGTIADMKGESYRVNMYFSYPEEKKKD